MLRSVTVRLKASVSSKWAFEAAVDRTADWFARHYPDWSAALFDRHYLRGRAAPILARCVGGSLVPDPDELARAWVEQLAIPEPRRSELIRSATPIAARLLLQLRQELHPSTRRVEAIELSSEELSQA